MRALSPFRAVCQLSHPRKSQPIGLPLRIKGLEVALAHIPRHRDVWVTTGDEIAS